MNKELQKAAIIKSKLRYKLLNDRTGSNKKHIANKVTFVFTVTKNRISQTFRLAK